MTFRNFLNGILLFGCMFAIGYAGYKWLWSRAVVTSMTLEMNQVPVPSMSICPLPLLSNTKDSPVYYENATTLTDLFDKVPPMEDYVQYIHLWSALSNDAIDLKDSWDVDEFFDIYLAFEGNPMLVRCASFNFNITSSPSALDTLISLAVNMTLFEELKIDLHEPGKKWSGLGSNVAEYNKHMGGNHFMKGLRAEKVVQMNRPSHECRDGNHIQMMDCIDEFIENELKCSLPWTKERDAFENNCSSIKDFLKIKEEIKTKPLGQTARRLQDFGCLVHDCHLVKWQMVKEELATAGKDELEDGHIWIQLWIPARETVKVYTEEDSYGFPSFVADFGGYMGLFLGASLGTLYDLVANSFAKSFKGNSKKKGRKTKS